MRETCNMVDGSKYRGQFLKDTNIKDGTNDTMISSILIIFNLGIGQMIYPDGSIFEGAFQDDDTAKGRYVFNNGYVYEGEMLNHKMHGQGVLRYRGKKIYSGEFSKGKQWEKKIDLTSTGDNSLLFTEANKLGSSKTVKFDL